jgi:sugar phosphate isomerase/epimerase
MGVKGRFPFRIGATSYVLAADMLTNVRYLADRVDDIELLVFESDAMAELPDATVLNELNRIARASSLTYTVHLPLDIRFGHPDPMQRELSLGKCIRTIGRMGVVDPVGFILHCDRQAPEDKALPDGEWIENTGQSLQGLLGSGIAPETVCVETLDRSFSLLEPLIREYGMSVCLDAGHVVLHGLDLNGYLERVGDLARVVHLHGVIDKKDHRSITGISRADLQAIVGMSASPKNGCRVVTLELFNQGDFEESLAIMEGLIPCTT